MNLLKNCNWQKKPYLATFMKCYNYGLHQLIDSILNPESRQIFFLIM